MSNTFLGIPLFVWGALCLVVAVLSAIVWPSRNVSSTTGLPYLILRWSHSAVWLLLALSCFLRATGIQWITGIANLLALGALALYIIFVMTLIRG